MTYRSSKTFEHAFSCAFRQFDADSHCNKMHGYALSVRLDFASDKLDHRNWVVDFGDFKELKKRLEDCFDHKTLVDGSDPDLEWYIRGQNLGVLDLVILPAIGIESFARYIFEMTAAWLREVYVPSAHDRTGVRLVKVEVWEHTANSASYSPG